MGVIVDIDGTLYDDAALFVRAFRAVGVRIRQTDINEWDFWRHHVDGPTFHRLIREHFHGPEAILGNTPYPDAAPTLQRWASLGAQIHIVSDRHTEAVPATAAWLAAHGIPVHTLATMSGPKKVAYATANGLRILIDDKPDTIIAAREAGLVTAALHTRYNREALAHPATVSGSSWGVIARRLERRCPHLRERPR